jgi:tripartite-type tricarboxylate transporter receptor subunit TctC
MRRRTFIQAASGSTLVQASAVRAQAYPSRPITIVAPFAAGGPTDTIARVIGEGLRTSLGQSIVVENVTGAAGTIGVGRAARAAPDGYTISIGHWGTHVLPPDGARRERHAGAPSHAIPMCPLSHMLMGYRLVFRVGS